MAFCSRWRATEEARLRRRTKRRHLWTSVHRLRVSTRISFCPKTIVSDTIRKLSVSFSHRLRVNGASVLSLYSFEYWTNQPIRHSSSRHCTSCSLPRAHAQMTRGTPGQEKWEDYLRTVVCLSVCLKEGREDFKISAPVLCSYSGVRAHPSGSVSTSAGCPAACQALSVTVGCCPWLSF